MSAAQDIGALGITPEERELAAEIAGAIQRKLPRSVQRDDLQQAALIGLWDAVRRDIGDRTPEQRRGYLITRIRGQILDELRAQDWAKRRHKKRKNGGAPLEPVVVVRFDDVGHREAGPSFEESLTCPEPSPEEQAIAKIDRGRAVTEALGAPLNDRHLHVVRGHYWNRQRFIDLANQLRTSEPRINQLHAQAIHTMRGWLTGEDTKACNNKAPLLVARKAIQKKWENHDGRRINRRAGGDPGAAPAESLVARSVPSRGLGRPTAAASARPVPAGAGGAELGGEVRPGVYPDPRSGPGHRIVSRSDAPRAFADEVNARRWLGGLTVTADTAAALAIPSTLPDEGIDLAAELERYRDWMIEQALTRTLGNRQQAANLLGLNRTTLVEMLKRSGASARAESPEMKQAEPEPSSPEALALASVARVAARIPWDRVAVMRAEGKSEGQISKILKGVIGAHQWTIEKALRLPRPLAKCRP
jgi:RNA polymerase sigma factor (sigma-70 family)